MQALNEHKLATKPPTTSLASRIFAVLFPGSPAVNAILATIYISGPPSMLSSLLFGKNADLQIFFWHCARPTSTRPLCR